MTDSPDNTMQENAFLSRLPLTVDGKLLVSSRLLAMCPVPMLLIDTDGIIYEWNMEAVRFYGYTERELAALNYIDLMSEADIERLPDYLREINEKHLFSRDTHARRKDGSLVPAHIYCARQQVDDRTFLWIFIRVVEQPAHADRTEETRNHHLHEFPRGFHDLIEEPRMVFEVDSRNTVTAMNTTALEKTGYDGVGAVGLDELFGADGALRLAESARGLQGEKISDSGEYTLVTRSGALFPVIASVTPPPPGVSTGGYRVMAFDLTEHKRVENDLMIMEKLRTLGEMAGGVVHDFNNILSIILGYTAMLKEQAAAPEINTMVEKVHNAALDGSKLVKRIQNFSRVNVREEMELVNLNDVAREVVGLLRPRWSSTNPDADKNIVFATSLGVLPAVLANPSEIREVLSNLIINSADAIEHSGTVTVTTENHADSVVLSVIDDGAGMNEETQAHIFEPFFTTKESAGTGLGMSVSYGIVNKMNGEIRVVSAPGEGTTISIILPMADADAVVPATADTAGDADTVTSPADTASETAALHDSGDDCCPVLIVDDEKNICEILSDFLTTKGFRVATACNGTDAWNLFVKNDFPLIVTDLHLGDVSGWDLAGRMKERHPETAIIMLTGYDTDISILNKSDTRIDHLLNKPINFSEFYRIVRETLDGAASE